MAKQATKRINGVIPLSGKAADWLEDHLKTAEPDPKAQATQAAEDAQFIRDTLDKALKK